MEVHHHPDLHHKKKHWKEYFLEFLMIFLAVTLGFFAESYREHLSDRSKEKEYMKELIEDLGKDSRESSDSTVRRLNNIIYRLSDSLIQLMSVKIKSQEDIIKAYILYYQSQASWFTAFFKDATISQLKNNGGFSLIENREVVNYINDYYKNIAIIDADANSIKDITTAIYNDEGRKIFDSRLLGNVLDTINAKATGEILDMPLTQLRSYIKRPKYINFLTSDDGDIALFCNDINSYKSTLIYYDQQLIWEHERANDLIAFIQKRYNLK